MTQPPDATSRPASWTQIAICTRLVTWSLSKSRDTCAFTVGTDRYSSPAISALLSPRPTASATSCSRSVSSASRASASAARAAAALAVSSGSSRSRRIRVRVTEGDSIGSSSTTLRIASTICGGGVSLSRNPSAPAASASTTCSSASNVVSTITRGGFGRACSSRVAPSPSRRGIRMSMSTTSGRSSPASRTPSSAVGGLADHLDVGVAAQHQGERGPHQRVVVDDEDRAWCSCRPRYPAVQDERDAVAAVLEPAAAQLGALGQADQAEPGARGARGPKPIGLRSSTSMPSSGEPLIRTVSSAPGACLRALVMPSCTIR